MYEVGEPKESDSGAMAQARATPVPTMDTEELERLSDTSERYWDADGISVKPIALRALTREVKRYRKAQGW